jgi:hypothetical protein
MNLMREIPHLTVGAWDYGLSSAEDPSGLGGAEDKGARAHRTAIAVVHPLCPGFAPSATGYTGPVQ